MESDEGKGGMRDRGQSMVVSYRGHSFTLDASVVKTLRDLKLLLEERTGVAAANQRVIHRGKALTGSEVELRTLGRQVKLMMVGSKEEELHELQAAKQAVESSRLRVINDLGGADGRGKIFGSRRGVGTVPRSQYCFQSIEVLPGLPEQERARAILTELADDAGVQHVLEKHRWTVGALAELYPEGYVGVSDVCVMGLNQNKGEKILLRLRTDDLKGFRKLLSIRKVLFHELAHMEHSEHDDGFYILMRQIEKEVEGFNATGRTLGGPSIGVSDAGGVLIGPTYEGGTGRVGGNADIQHLFSARELAASAAAARQLSEEERRIEDGCGCGGKPVHARPHDAESPVVDVAGRTSQKMNSGVGAYGEAKGGEVTDGAGDHSTQEGESSVIEVEDAEDKAGDPEPMEVIVADPEDDASDDTSSPRVMTDAGMTDAEESGASTAQLSAPAAPSLPQPVPRPSPPIHTDTALPLSSDPSGPYSAEVAELFSMGFASGPSLRALEHFNGDLAPAVDYLVNHGGSFDLPPTGAGSSVKGGGGNVLAGGGRDVRVVDGAERLRREVADEKERSEAVQTLRLMVQAILNHPGESKYRRVRVSNSKFHRAVGRHPAALDLLDALGFETSKDGKFLELSRDDPGLLWLGKSALEGV